VVDDVQTERIPGKEKESNWLSALKRPLVMAMLLLAESRRIEGN